MSGNKSEHVIRFHRSADSGVVNEKSLGHIEEPNRFLLFPHIAPPPDVVPPSSSAWLLKNETLPLSVTWRSLLDSKDIAPVRDGGGVRETNHAKSVQESLSTA